MGVTFDRDGITCASFSSRIKQELKRDLEETRRPGLQDLTESRRLQIVFRKTQVGVIQGIKRLCPELGAHSLANLEVLEQRKIYIFDAGPAYDVSPLVPNRPAWVTGFNCWNAERPTQSFGACGPLLGFEIRSGRLK